MSSKRGKKIKKKLRTTFEFDAFVATVLNWFVLLCKACNKQRKVMAAATANVNNILL